MLHGHERDVSKLGEVARHCATFRRPPASPAVGGDDLDRWRLLAARLDVLQEVRNTIDTGSTILASEPVGFLPSFARASVGIEA
jgi:hypothetical protein